MRIVLTTAALVIASGSASAQTAQRFTPWRHAPDGYENLARMPPASTWWVPADNTRAPFAAHVGANGQGTY